MAEATAPNKKIKPTGDTCIEKSFSKTIKTIPRNDIIKPKVLNFESLSLVTINTAIGVNTGIDEIITALIVGETSLIPKFSPRKYKNGLKNAVNKNNK